jgi:DNA (cytosine-5)-methyltransferase 1
MSPINSSLTAFSAFSGMDGFRVGAEATDLKCIGGCDTDSYARIAGFLNFRDVLLRDVKEVDRTTTKPFDILMAGLPCTPFSKVGNRTAFNHPDGLLYLEVVRLLRDFRPKAALIENVPFLIKHAGGITIQTILSAIHEAGYSIHLREENAAKHSAPTARNRVYIVCFRDDHGIEHFNWPKPTLIPTPISSVLLPEDDCRTESLFIDDKKFHPTRGPAKKNPFMPIKLGYVEKDFRENRVFSIDAPAPTFLATSPQPGGALGFYMINGRIRRLHQEEMLAAMRFPPNFLLPFAPAIVDRLIGNSVAVPVVRKILNQIKITLEEV